MTASFSAIPDVTPFDLWWRDRLQPLGSVARGARGAGAAEGFDADDFARADLLSVQFADGSVLHTRPEDFVARHAPAQALVVAARGAAPDAASGSGRVVLPFELAVATATRGAAQPVKVERYGLARLTEATTLDRLYDFGTLFARGLDGWFGTEETPLGAVLAGKLCAAYESATLHPSVGAASGVLLRWQDGGWQPAHAALDGALRVLLFLHGTASSTDGSFAALWQPAARQSTPPTDLAAALAPYSHVLSWEHRSLTRSPLDNAIALLKALEALPAECGIDIVSHSRGGLVGELFSLSGVAADDLRGFRDVFDLAYPAQPRPHPDQPRIGEFFDALGLKRHDIGTFVRVACPARGTLLADRRTDLFLSLLLRSVGLAFGTAGVPLYERFNGLVQSLVAARADAHALPGLEAMIPGSPLTLALNMPVQAASGPPPTLPGRLRVIAGDTRDLGWGGLTTLLGDVFYGLHDHDFVVHTHSMFGGLPRADAKSLRIEDKSVTHFGYFKRDALSRQPLLAMLAGRDEGLQPLAEDERRTRNWVRLLKRDPLSSRSVDDWMKALRHAEDRRRPVLVVLPGIMGSELSELAAPDHQGGLVWLSIRALLDGGLEGLAVGSEARLRPSGLVAVAYERLLEAAGSRFNVVAWPFDWRASLAESSGGFASLLERILALDEPAGVPVHVLAHSMGGLVALLALFGAPAVETGMGDGRAAAMPARRGGDASAGAALWSRLRLRGGRLLMLGTPNAGSYAPVQLLLQQHNLSRLLALVARGVSAGQLAAWGGGFAGLLEMMPSADDPTFGNLFQPDTWARIRDADHRTRPPPSDALARARVVSRAIARTFETLGRDQDPNVLYVAGQGPTPIALRRPPGPWQESGEGLQASQAGVEFAYGAGGDGTVGWNSTLDVRRTWYAACEHGDLADCEPAFEAYFELLNEGRTLRLPQQPPSTRAAAQALARDAADASAASRADGLPSWPHDVAGYVLGLKRRVAARADAPRVEVRVVHGSLDYARYPLMAGHYLNEHLNGAVRRVDEKLGGQLQRMLDLKLFAGAGRTGVYLRPETPDGRAPPYAGALVLGLGSVGELTPALLADTVTRGVLRFAFEHVHRDPFVDRQDPVLLRLSSVLIGTHVQALAPRDSLAGVMQGVWRAAQLLSQDAAVGRPVQLVEVEIIEIEETIALDAAYELNNLLKRPEWAERLHWARPLLESRDGGLRGYRPRGAGSVWQRLVIEHDSAGGLRYSLIAERARVESTRVFSDVASLRDYIAGVTDEGALGRSVDIDPASFGRVLFQLLLPQDLKGRLANFDNTVLVVDDEAACQPWELLTPPGRDAEGSEDVRPLAVQAGLVRQRITDDFRRVPSATQDWNALVVGAPDTRGWKDAQGNEVRFQPLGGALAEARHVEQALADDGRTWSTTTLIGEGVSFQRVHTTLLERPYRLLHLAGHGVVDTWVADVGTGHERRALRKTGMVLSHQHVLAAADVEQMDPAPEFVFINCCYSGRDPEHDGAAGAAHGQRNYPVLAASLALQFIRMGSKAVVAAGWQVDDADGKEFAQTLYREVLQGRGFGESVREARKRVWRAGAGATNTWGAYQCYGDPEWRLKGAGPGARYAEAQGTSRLRGAAQCMSHHELAQRIQQVVEVAGDKPRAPVLLQLDDLERALRIDPDRREWLDSSLVRAAFGEAYRELGDHAKAVTWFQRSARIAYSKLQLRHLELMVNSLSRLGGNAHDVAQELLRRLDGLDDDSTRWSPHEGALAPPGDAQGAEGASSGRSERECLRGSDLMRRASAATAGAPGPAAAEAAERARLLFAAASAFAHGYKGKRVSPPDHADRRAFALSNAMLCTALGTLSAGRTEVPQGMLRRLENATAGAARATSPHQQWQTAALEMLQETAHGGLATKFWHYTNTMELLTSRNLLALLLPAASGDEPTDADIARELDSALTLLRTALERWPSPSERESLAYRYRLMCDVLVDYVPASRAAGPLPQRAAAAVDAMCERLEPFERLGMQALDLLGRRAGGGAV